MIFYTSMSSEKPGGLFEMLKARNNIKLDSIFTNVRFPPNIFHVIPARTRFWQGSFTCVLLIDILSPTLQCHINHLHILLLLLLDNWHLSSRHTPSYINSSNNIFFLKSCVKSADHGRLRMRVCWTTLYDWCLHLYFTRSISCNALNTRSWPQSGWDQ